MFDVSREKYCVECFRLAFLEGKEEHERPADGEKNYEPIEEITGFYSKMVTCKKCKRPCNKAIYF